MFEQKKFVALTEGNVPTCYIPGQCMECKLDLFKLKPDCKIYKMFGDCSEETVM